MISISRTEQIVRNALAGMPPQPLGVDILQVFTTDIYHDLPSKTPALKGVAWKDLLVPFVGVVRDLKDLSGAKVVLLQDFARKVQLPLLQEGPYPTTGMMSWLEVGCTAEQVSQVRRPAVRFPGLHRAVHGQ